MTNITYSKHEKDGKIILFTARKIVTKSGNGGGVPIPANLIGQPVFIVYGKKKELPEIFESLAKRLREANNILEGQSIHNTLGNKSTAPQDSEERK